MTKQNLTKKKNLEIDTKCFRKALHKKCWACVQEPANTAETQNTFNNLSNSEQKTNSKQKDADVGKTQASKIFSHLKMKKKGGNTWCHTENDRKING